MLAMFISIFPILTAILCLLLKKNTSQSMTTGIIVGLAVFLIKNGVSFENLKLIGNTTVTTITGNTTVLLNIFLLFIIVYLIQNSTIINALNNLTEDYLCSSSRVVIFLIIFGIIFSLDDYLACIAMGTILTSAATKQGFSKEKLAFMINITAVSCCCISPFSSWMPVLKSALSISGIQETVIYQTIPYNYSALLGLLLVIIVGLFRPNAFNSSSRSSNQCKNPAKQRGKEKNPPELIAFFIIIFTLIGSLISMMFVFQCSNAVIKSATICIIITIPVLVKLNAINYIHIQYSVRKALKSTWDLGKLLLSIWLLANVCNNILGLADNIAVCTNNANFPIRILPAAIFAISGIFAFSTGSAYGTFGLFIPLTAHLTNDVSSSIQTLTITAAISGSLMAANSFASDTLELTSKNTQSNKEYLQFAQLPYGFLIYALGIFSFLVSGVCIQYGNIFAIIIPIAISICMTIGHFLLSYALYAQIERTVSNLLTSHLSVRSRNYEFVTNPYPPLTYSLHSLHIMLEKYIQLRITVLYQKITSYTAHFYPLKIPDLL